MKEACRAIILNHEGEVLLAKRPQGIGKGQYSLPGGKPDNGESLESAVVREVKEELGLDFTPAYYSESINSVDGRNMWKTTYFTGEVRGNINPDINEIEDVVFVSEAGLDDIDVAFDHRDRLREFFRSRRST